MAGEEGKIHLEAGCLFVEGVGSIGEWFVLEGAMMEGEQSAAAAVALSTSKWCIEIDDGETLTAVSSTRRSCRKLVEG